MSNLIKTEGILKAEIEKRKNLDKEKAELDFSNKYLVIGKTFSVSDFQFDESQEINTELYKSSIKIMSMGAVTQYSLGKEFERVHSILGNNKNGTYMKFVKMLGFNPRMVQRYRLRYYWVETIKNLKKNTAQAVEIISLLGINLLEEFDVLAKDDVIKEVLLEYLQEDNMTLGKFREHLRTEINEQNLLEIKNNDSDMFEFQVNFNEKLKNIKKLDKKIQVLSKDKKELINDYLSKIESILASEVIDIEEK